MKFHVKRLLFLFIVLSFTSNIYAQGSIVMRDIPFTLDIAKDKNIEQSLEANSYYNKLNKDEQEIIYWINYVRTNPRKFNHEVLAPFLKQFPEVKNAYSKSLSAYLLSIMPVGLLFPEEKLTKAAITHATDLGKNGASISHKSTSGDSFQQRMGKLPFNNIAENIYEGRRSPLEAVISLLIDNGVKNLGHRQNILSADMKYIGVSFYPIKSRSNMYFMVQDFGG